MDNSFERFFIQVTGLISKPFIYLTIFLFFNQLSYWYIWIVSFFLILFLYSELFSIINHYRCILEWEEFESIFIDKKTKRFEITKIDNIEFDKFTIINYKVLAEQLALPWGYSESELNKLNKNPVRGFFAKRITKSILASNKAYSFYVGPFTKHIIILRQNHLPSDSFERFLIFHEISHIDFKGFNKQLSFNQEKYSLFVNIAILFLIVQQSHQYFFFVIYTIFSIHYIFSILKNRIETYADISALAKLNDNKERLSVLNLLIRYYSGEEKKYNRKIIDWQRRKEYSFRRAQLMLINNILTTGLFHDSSIYTSNKYIQIAKENHKSIIDFFRDESGEVSFPHMLNFISGGQEGYTIIMIILNIYLIYSFKKVSIQNPFLFISILLVLSILSIIGWKMLVKKCFIILDKLSKID